MQIDFGYDTSTASAPAGFFSALTYVAGVLDALITNPVTITIQVGWNEINGTALASGELAAGGDSPGNDLSYGQLVADLTAHATSPAVQQELASLPANAQSQLSAGLFVTTAQEKAWGLATPGMTGPDGYVGFSSNYSYSFDPNNQDVSGEYGFIGVAEHEITHALGRLVGDGAFALTNYAEPGVLNTSGGNGYYSIDGGKTDLAGFAPAGKDPGDWAGQPDDAFNAVSQAGTGGNLTQLDQTLLETLGFSVGNTQFSVADETAGTTTTENGTPYTGPVAGLTQELIVASSHNLDVTAYAPNSFIHISGTGTNGINVAPAGGNNVIDVASASNFMIGGAGDDTFSLDDRSPATNAWSSIVNFHAGDHATLWGISLADFTPTWLNGQGAPGSTGLTGLFTAAGKPEVAVTLAGYTTNDLTNGRLSVAYGTTSDQPGMSATPYVSITAT